MADSPRMLPPPDPHQALFDYWNQRASGYQQALAAPTANNLGASDWNALRDARDYAVNSRAAAFPEPWQQTYVAPTPSTENMLAAIKVQQDQATLDNTLMAGKTARQAYSQSAQAFPLKQQEALSGLQSAAQLRQKGALDVYAEGAKSFHPNATPEDIFTTYNGDPAHPNQFRVAGGFRSDPSAPGGFVQTPDQWVYAQPEHVDAFRRSAPAGYSTPLSSTQIAMADSVKAQRLHELMARANAPAVPLAGGPVNFTRTPAGGFQMQDVQGDPFGAERALGAQVQQQDLTARNTGSLLSFLQSQRANAGVVRAY